MMSSTLLIDMWAPTIQRRLLHITESLLETLIIAALQAPWPTKIESLSRFAHVLAGRCGLREI
jgi:hypothetical protein